MNDKSVLYITHACPVADNPQCKIQFRYATERFEWSCDQNVWLNEFMFKNPTLSREYALLELGILCGAIPTDNNNNEIITEDLLLLYNEDEGYYHY